MRTMRRVPKDSVHAQAMKLMPKAPYGMKKKWTARERHVEYVQKTPKEMLRSSSR